ncbi:MULTISPECIES: hypothetical protein [Sphingomonas]|jgi:hypothetical protein|uniref:hypothetical protein n=1 Tax=Sphingomonas TaxID=13687 RepID=UPI001FD0A4FF|nr:MULTISPECIES: hypothetical protein [unclassified Sphingomonas]
MRTRMTGSALTAGNPPGRSAAGVVQAGVAQAGADIVGLEPLKTFRSRWPAIIGAVLTLAMIAGLARELFAHGLAGLSRSVPSDPRFYLCFALLYMSPPTGDYVIFRRLWGIPVAGLVALIKKRIANEVVFGYSGDAYFYAWARARARMVASPFGAVKDVTILSAIAGNAITLAMVAIALPLSRDLLPPDLFKTVLGSAAITFAISLPFLIFSRRVFSLPRATLWWVFMIHCIRLMCGSLLIALAWHFALPGVSIAMWLFLAAGRLLVSRLPLVPNKDLLFANFAILLIGQDQALSELVAFTAALTLLVHVILIVIFSGHAIAMRTRA